MRQPVIANHLSDETHEALLAQWDRLVWRYVTRATNIPAAHWELAVHDIRVYAWRARHTYDPARGAYQTWLGQVCRQVTSRWDVELGCRKPRSETPLRHVPAEVVLTIDAPLDDATATVGETLADPADVEREVLARLDIEQVRALAQMLPDRERGVVELLADGETCAEIGRRIGLSKTRVSQLRDRAVGRMQAMAGVD